VTVERARGRDRDRSGRDDRACDYPAIYPPDQREPGVAGVDCSWSHDSKDRGDLKENAKSLVRMP
jgi:hypothetical protein